MEKVKIKTCIDSGKKYQEKPIIEIVLEDGRKGSCFDTAFLGLPIGQEIEIDIKPAKDYNNEKRFYFNMPGQQKNGSKFPQKDWTFEKRKASLENSIEWCKGKDLKTKDVLECATVFFNYLNEK
jgi:hypothetical protein